MIPGKIRFAVIGYGHIGRRHADLIRAREECELVAICDTRSPADPGDYPAGVPFFGEEDELMAQDFDVLCVATPNGLHERHAIKALTAGHHVLIEKPMALTAEACERIIRAAEERQRQVFCVMQNRYSGPSVWLKALLEQKGLGRIFLVTVNCFWNRDERYYRKGDWRGSRDLDGGVLFTQFSHFIDSLLWLFGDIENIEAQFRNFSHSGLTDFADSGTVSFSWRQGGIGNLNFTTSVWLKNLESSLTVIGEKGTVKISGQYMDEIEICHVAGHEMPEGLKLPSPTLLPGQKKSVSNHTYIFENIVAVLKRGGRPDIDPREAGRIVATIEKIYSRKQDI